MGGPAAWKEMQKRQNEWQNEGFDQQRAQVNVQDHGDANSDDTQTRDIYAEYDIDPPTEHEENLQNRSDDSDTNVSCILYSEFSSIFHPQETRNNYELRPP